MARFIERIKNRTESGMETAQVILILGIVVGLIAVLFPAISSTIQERGQKADACISGVNMDSSMSAADC